MGTDVRAVLFDCDGVLQRASNDWRSELLALVGSPSDEATQLAFFMDLRDAEVPTSDGSLAFVPRLEAVLSKWGSPSTAAEAMRIWQQLTVDAGMLEAARELAEAGIICAIATNQHAERAEFMRRTLGYEATFDPLFFSCEIGLAKPDPAYFTYAVERLGLESGQVLFVDDMLPNVEGARTAGLRAEYFARDAGRPELDRILALHGLHELSRR